MWWNLGSRTEQAVKEGNQTQAEGRTADSSQRHVIWKAGSSIPRSTTSSPPQHPHSHGSALSQKQINTCKSKAMVMPPTSLAAAAAAKLLQSCPTLCDPIDGSPAGSPVPGILQARTLEWVAISFSTAWKWKVKVKLLSLVRLLVTPWAAARQAPPSVGFSRQEYWSGVPLPSLVLLFHVE